jgi:hypothetical protein
MKRARSQDRERSADLSHIETISGAVATAQV